jgi:hypothetical protein
VRELTEEWKESPSTFPFFPLSSSLDSSACSAFWSSFSIFDFEDFLPFVSVSSSSSAPCFSAAFASSRETFFPLEPY